MFSFDPSFDGPLVPPSDQWPVFDEVVVFSVSPSSSPSPSVQSDALPPAPFPSLADMPVPPSRASSRNKNPNHIPRPRNAFMLFRSAFAAAQTISANIEHDNRHITRIIANCWNRLSDTDRQIWRDKAAAEKAQHAERYPDYRFRPVGRAKRPKKRKVRRNGVEDVKRCETVADLVMAGKYGPELERAMKTEPASASQAQDVFASDDTCSTLLAIDASPQDPETDDVPPFRSPLLPPAKTGPQHVQDKSLMPQPLLTIAAQHVEPQTFCTLTRSGASPSQDDLQCFALCYQYQSDLHSDASSASSIPPVHYQSVSVAGFVTQSIQSGHAEPDQSVPDCTLFSWNQSDSFSYYN